MKIKSSQIGAVVLKGNFQITSGERVIDSLTVSQLGLRNFLFSLVLFL